MKQSLVVICSSIEEAMKAAVDLPMYQDMNKFYVLNCEVSSTHNFNWLNPQDNYIVLGKVSQLGNSAEICVRAAILYIPSWWHLLFTYAHDMPSISDINEIKLEIDKSKGFLQKNKIWGVSREHLLLFGLGKIFGSGTIKNEQEILQNELEIVKALKGEPASLQAIIEAFIEEVNTDGMVFQGAIPNYSNESTKYFLNHMLDRFNVVPENPGVIFVAPNTTTQGLQLLLSQIDKKTMVCILDEKDIDIDLQAYKEFICSEGFKLKIFMK
jgi:hypothetical protein